MKLIKYIKGVRNGTTIPLFRCNINKNKYRENIKGSCDVQIHPLIATNLSTKDHELVKYHMNCIVDIIRANIEDVEDL